MNNVIENQKYLQSVHDDLLAKLFSIFRNENIKVKIQIDELSNSDLVKFADLDDILKCDDFNFADILDNKYELVTKYHINKQ
jgi:hypothetical protein